MSESVAKSELGRAETTDILKLLPHRYPFLLVDRIVEMDSDRSATGIKTVSVNEPYFQGHFPHNPVMPGMLLVEGMAQTAGALCIRHLKEFEKPPLIYFMSIDRATACRKFAIVDAFGASAGRRSSTPPLSPRPKSAP
jgi:3-hydroxyacyl-[acyl-carrier-protein] dehydratase